MIYMLDTNMIIYAMNGRPDQLKKLFMKFGKNDLCISAIAMAELEFCVSNSSRINSNRDNLYRFISGFEIMPFDSNAAREYGDIRADLKRKGQMIGSNDMLIAAHAKSLGLTLVTNNIREFSRVDGLKVENWLN